MNSHKILAALILVAASALPVRAEPIGDDRQRKWSQPGYEAPDVPLTTAPELDSFPGTPDDDATLLGDEPPLAQDAPRTPPSR